ncbi:MAG: peptide deformylase [Oscillospiraceae bacterium]
MIKPIVKDKFLLSQKSSEADKNDSGIVTDLQDTLKAHRHECVGMAANMIGALKRIIIVEAEQRTLVMINPVIVWASPETYNAEEGCLCHEGTKPVTRHRSIEVEFASAGKKRSRKRYSGFTAQIIQHEIDHLNGMLV